MSSNSVQGSRSGAAPVAQGSKYPMSSVETGLEQPPDLGHGQDVVVGVLAVAVGAAAGLEQTLGFVVAQQMRTDSGPPAQFPDQHSRSSLTFISV